MFNAVTTGEVYAADQLFATLDPTVRKLEDLDCGPAVLADTVGFIRELPHDLVAAFRATLAEARDADLLLHVMRRRRRGARAAASAWSTACWTKSTPATCRSCMVMNKIDLLDTPPRIDRDAAGQPTAVWLSAATGAGLDLLRQAIGRTPGR